MSRPSARIGIVALALAVAGCTPDRPAPPDRSFAGLPVTGSIASARRAGFNHCVDQDAVHVRCRRSEVTIFGQGPYQAAVDLRGSAGESGFHHVTVWHDDDPRALYRVPKTLVEQGWSFCFTGGDRGGDQAIFTRPDVPFFIFMDISYYGERRIRIFPKGGEPQLSGPCKPGTLSLFGLDPPA